MNKSIVQKLQIHERIKSKLFETQMNEQINQNHSKLKIHEQINHSKLRIHEQINQNHSTFKLMNKSIEIVQKFGFEFTCVNHIKDQEQ